MIYKKYFFIINHYSILNLSNRFLTTSLLNIIQYPNLGSIKYQLYFIKILY